MQFSVNRQHLLPVLASLMGIIERRKTLPILSNVFFSIKNDKAILAATDMEVQMVDSVILENASETGKFTVAGRKLFDIVRVLPENEIILFSLNQDKLTIKANKSKYLLYTLPADDFPTLDDEKVECELLVNNKMLRTLLEMSNYAVAEQEVRLFLNGLLLDISAKQIVAVGADGHRLACATASVDLNCSPKQIVIPRKTVLEVLRLLPSDQSIELLIGITTNHFILKMNNLSFTSKLVDAQYPDYRWLFKREENKKITVDKAAFKQLLTRVAVMANDKFGGVWLIFKENLLTVITSNKEHESAEDALAVEYQGDTFETGYNIQYLIEAVSLIQDHQICLLLKDIDSPLFIEGANNTGSVHVLMPMRI